MSKNQAKPALTLTQEQLDTIKYALWRIDWTHEQSLSSPVPSDGYGWIMADMAEHIRKTLGIEELR